MLSNPLLALTPHHPHTHTSPLAQVHTQIAINKKLHFHIHVRLPETTTKSMGIELKAAEHQPLAEI